MKTGSRPKAWPRLARFGGLVILLLLWQLVTSFRLVPYLILPPPLDVVADMRAHWDVYLDQTLATLQAVILSVLFASVISIVLGLLFSSTRRLQRKMSAVLSSCYAIPMVVLYPVLTAWLGLGLFAKVTYGSVFGAIPATLVFMAGIRSIGPNLIITGRCLGASAWQQILFIKVPASIPAMLSTVRVGGSLAIVGVIVAEMLASTSGLGLMLTNSQTRLDSPAVYGGIVSVMAVAVCFNVFMHHLENRVGRYYKN